MDEIGGEGPVFPELPFGPDRGLERIRRVRVVREDLHLLLRHGHGAAQELIARGGSERSGQVDVGGRGAVDRDLQRLLAIEDLLIDYLVGLDIGIVDSSAAADHCLAIVRRVVSKADAWGEVQVVATARRDDAACQTQGRIEDAEIVVIAQAKVEREPLVDLPIVLHPERNRVAGNVDIKVSEALHVTKRGGSDGI